MNSFRCINVTIQCSIQNVGRIITNEDDLWMLNCVLMTLAPYNGITTTTSEYTRSSVWLWMNEWVAVWLSQSYNTEDRHTSRIFLLCCSFIGFGFLDISWISYRTQERKAARLRNGAAPRDEVRSQRKLIWFNSSCKPARRKEVIVVQLHTSAWVIKFDIWVIKN